MKTNFLIIIILLSVTASCQNSEKSNSEIIDSRKEINLIDSVKSYKKRTYTIKGEESGKFIKGDHFNREIIKNPRTKVDSESRFLLAPNINVTFTSRGEIQSIIQIKNNEEEGRRISYSYDTSGILLERILKYDNKKTKKINEVGLNGKVKMTKLYNKNNELMSYSKFEYNKSQKLIAEESFDNTGTLKVKYIHKYGKNAKIATEQEQDSKIYFIINNNANQIINYKYLTTSGSITYNLKGSVIKVEKYSDGESSEYYVNKLDTKQNVISQSHFNDSKEESLDMTINYKYKYDTHGNWIERVAYSFDTPKWITVREIKYF